MSGTAATGLGRTVLAFTGHVYLVAAVAVRARSCVCVYMRVCRRACVRVWFHSLVCVRARRRRRTRTSTQYEWICLCVLTARLAASCFARCALLSGVRFVFVLLRLATVFVRRQPFSFGWRVRGARALAYVRRQPTRPRVRGYVTLPRERERMRDRRS